MKKLSILFLVLISLPFLPGCSNGRTAKKDEKISKDTFIRPAGMTQQAVLLNFGSDDDSIMVWADYIGVFKHGDIKYAHIYGVRYYYVQANQNDTLYYENMELRSGAKQFDFKNYSILNYPGDATIFRCLTVRIVSCFSALLNQTNLQERIEGLFLKEYRN